MFQAQVFLGPVGYGLEENSLASLLIDPVLEATDDRYCLHDAFIRIKAPVVSGAFFSRLEAGAIYLGRTSVTFAQSESLSLKKMKF